MNDNFFMLSSRDVILSLGKIMIIDVINDSRMEEYLMVAIWDLLSYNVIIWSGHAIIVRLLPTDLL